MTSHEHKKIYETQILRNFIHAHDEFPKSKIVGGESPDFIVKPNKKSAIGIELSELYIPDNSGKAGQSAIEEEVKQRIVERTKELFQLKNSFPLSVNICYAEGAPFFRLNIPSFSAGLSAILEKKLQNYNVSSFFQCRLKGFVLPDCIASVSLVHHPDDKLSMWKYNTSIVKQQMFIDLIENIILKKEDKLELYQKKLLDSYWLLIHTGDLKCLMNFNLNNLIERWGVNSNFDSIFIFDYFNGSYFTLH